MKQFRLLILSLAALLTTLNTNAQLSKNIHINNALLTDLQQAADQLGFDGAVVVGDTISLEDNIEFHGLSLILMCNHLMSRQNSIACYPYKKDSAAYGANGKGIAGSQITIFSKTPVHGSFELPGGDGKPGANGRDGRSGEIPAGPDACCTARNKGQAGGDGQDGFPGGNGGRLSAMTLSKKDSSVIALTGEGGQGGAGGRAGKGGTSYAKSNNRPPRTNTENPGANDPNPYRITQEKDGKPGRPGKNGTAATFSVKQVMPNEFRKELQKYGVDSLGASQAAFTTLINLKTPQRPGSGINRAVISGSSPDTRRTN